MARVFRSAPSVHSARVMSARALSNNGSRLDFNHLYFRSFKLFLFHNMDYCWTGAVWADCQMKMYLSVNSTASTHIVGVICFAFPPIAYMST